MSSKESFSTDSSPDVSLESSSSSKNKEKTTNERSKSRRKQKHAGSQAVHSLERAEAADQPARSEKKAKKKNWFEEAADKVSFLGEKTKESLAETKTASAEDAPIDGTSPKERKVIGQVTGEAELKELSPERLNSDDPLISGPELAAEDFWEEMAKHGDPELAVERVGAKMEIPDKQIAEINAETELPVDDEDGEPGLPALNETDEQPQPQAGETIFNRNETGHESTEVYIPQARGGGGTGSIPPGGGSNNTPPYGGGDGYVPNLPFGAAPVGYGYNPNLAPTSPTTSSKEHEPLYDSGNPAVTALIGGIIGYLIGRRRGRIKTEKKLLPIQRKLSKEVVNLEWQLKAKETKIRQLAAEQVRSRGPVAIEKLANKKVLGERAATARRRGQEANLLHAEQKAPERIGRVLVSAEAAKLAARPKAETSKKEEEKAEKLNLPEQKNITTLNRAELLTLSEKILVDGSTLRQIYDTHLIGERGLRRLVGEHLRGGDIKKVLRQEIVEREIDFERDPALRDMGAIDTSSLASSPTTSKAALNKLLERADASIPAISISEEAAFYKARANYQAQEHDRQRQQRQLIDMTLIGLVGVLVITILIIYLIRR